MDNNTLSDSPHVEDQPPDFLSQLFCFIEKGRAEVIKEKQQREIYGTNYAVNFPGNKVQPKRKSKGKAPLIPLGRLQFSRHKRLQSSSLSKEDVFRLYIWCGIGSSSRELAREYIDQLPSRRALTDPAVIDIYPNRCDELYVVDLARRMIERSVNRKPIYQYEKGVFQRPVVIIGRSLSWDEVHVPAHFNNF